MHAIIDNYFVHFRVSSLFQICFCAKTFLKSFSQINVCKRRVNFLNNFLNIVVISCLIILDILHFAESINESDNKHSSVLLHHYMSDDERLLLFGHNSNEVPNYEVFEPNNEVLRHRSHRAIRSTNNSSSKFTRKLPHRIQVNFRAFGENFSLRLRRNYRLLSPLFTIKEEMINKNTVDINNHVQSNCYFHGYSTSHPNSSAAISICDGMRGIIETVNAIYVINPLPQRVMKNSDTFSNSTHSRPHIILKKESLEEYQCPHIKKQISVVNEVSLDETLSDEKNHNGLNRSRRSSDTTNDITNYDNIDLSVETAVFIDETLYSLMQRTFPTDTEQQIVTYVLTIMNAVQLLFKQPSLGKTVDISVVLMDILKQQPRDLASSDNIDTYLTNFCVWQHKKRLQNRGLTPRWDHALLLSGINMYVVDGLGRKKRHVVGLAPVSGMCNSLNSCTISEGTSFQTVLVAGHEMGHSLGMEHDGSQDGNVCDQDNYIMSPTLGAGKTTWSSCSRDYLDKFIRTTQANCILGSSSHVNIINQFISRDKLPGQAFNADQQCALRFGSDARHSLVQPLQDICRLLRCDTGSTRNTVAYHAHPALEGTNCGHNRLCREGRCVPYDIPSQPSMQYAMVSVPSDVNTKISIDGGWTEWSPYSDCSSECITRASFKPMGVTVSTRKCDNPKPSNGGKQCDASDKRVKLCDASQICVSFSFRTMNVDEYISDTCRAAAHKNNNLEPKGTQYPSYDSSHTCFVWCHKKGGGFMTQGWKLPDGSPCGKDNSVTHNRYCFDGECRFFDCNGESKQFEITEQCPQTSNSLYDMSLDQGWSNWMPLSKCHYSCTVTAKGFRLVSRECNLVTNCGGSRESFQLCSEQKEFCEHKQTAMSADDYANDICGKYRNKYPTLLSGIGRQLSARKTNIHSSCTVACQDRIWHDIHYQMDAFDDGKFPSGTDCSLGSGENAYCVNGKCLRFDESDIPIDEDINDREHVRQFFNEEYRFQNRHRRSAPVPFRTSEVQEHSDPISENASWDRRITPVRWQSVTPSRPIQLSNTDGRNQTLRVEPYVWSITLTECNKLCAKGYRTVNVFCYAGRYIVNQSLCDSNTKPGHSGVEQCNVQPCIGSWKTEEWSACSSTCGRAFRTRSVICVKQIDNSSVYSIINHKYCDSDTRPKQLQMCQPLPLC